MSVSKVAEFFVQLGADVSQYSRGMKEADMINKEMMRSFKNLQKQIDSDYFLLAKGSQEFAMSQKDLESKILELGAEHKKITDQMINSNDAFRASIFRQIGTVQNMTNQSAKLQEALTNYGGAIRKADVLTLGLGNRLENMAKQGQVALVALRMLGPQASNKQLVDMIKTLNQGIMRYQSVALAAGIATLVLAGALFKLAKASDPLLDDRLAKSAKLWLDALQPLGMAVSGLIRAFLALTDPIAKFLLYLKEIDPALAAATAGFFALLVPLSLLLAPLATGATGLNAFRIAFASVFMLIKPFVLGFLSIAGTVAIVAAAIVSIAAIFYKMWQNSENLRKAVYALGAAFQTGLLYAFNLVKTSLSGLVETIASAIQTIAGESIKGKNAWETLGNAFVLVVNFVKTYVAPILIASFILIGAAIASLLYIITTIVTEGVSLFKFFTDTVPQLWTQFVTAIVTKATELWNSITNIFNQMVSTIKGIWTTIINMSAADWGFLIGSIVKKVMELPAQVGAWLDKTEQRINAAFLNFVVQASKGASNVINAISDFFSQLPNKIWGFLVTTALKIVSFGQDAQSKAKTAGSNTVKGFIDTLSSLPSKLGSIITDAINSLVSAGSGLYNKAKTMASNFWTGFKKGLGINSPSYVDLAFMSMGEQALAAQKLITSSVPKMTRSLTSAARPIQPMAAAASGPQPIDMTRSGTGAGAGTIIIQNMQVRSDSDIVDISNRLYRLQQTQLRGRGVGGEIFGQ